MKKKIYLNFILLFIFLAAGYSMSNRTKSTPTPSPFPTPSPKPEISTEGKTQEEIWVAYLEREYPGKTFIIKNIENSGTVLYGTVTSVDVYCPEDDIEFTITNSLGVDSYQREVWKRELIRLLNEELKQMYGDNYAIILNFCSFEANGVEADLKRNNQPRSGAYSTGIQISEKYYNTTYQEALAILAEQKGIVDNSSTAIHFVVFTEQVDKNKEIENIKTLYRKFILPVNDSVRFIEATKWGTPAEERHVRGYVLSITYRSMAEKEEIIDYNYPHYDTYPGIRNIKGFYVDEGGINQYRITSLVASPKEEEIDTYDWEQYFEN